MERNGVFNGLLFVTAGLVFGIPYRVNTAEQTANVKLAKNGSTVDETQLPTCLDVGAIKLLSYRYLCWPPGSECTTLKEKFSSAAEVIVHEMCSLQETCISSAFPQADLSDVARTMVEIKYLCLDQFETFVDICYNTSKTDDKTVHLIYNKKNTVLYEDCQCNIKGEFALTLNDIRFKSTHIGMCSKASFTVHNQTYSCDNKTDSYGSMFRKSIGEGLSDETVVLSFDPTSVGPEMIYISIIPSESKSIQLVCRHTPITFVTTTTERVTEPFHTQNITISAGRDSTWPLSTGLTIGVGVAVVAILGCFVAVIIICWRKRRKQHRRLDSKDRKVRKNLLSKNSNAQSPTEAIKVTVEDDLSEYDNIESNDRALQPTQEATTTANTREVINKAPTNNTLQNRTDPHTNKNNKKTVLPIGRKDNVSCPKATRQRTLGNQNEKLMSGKKAEETQAHHTEISQTPQDSEIAQQKTYEGTSATDAAVCDEKQLSDSDLLTKILPNFLFKRMTKSENVSKHSKI